MEALEAIGLASNLLQFIELGFKLAAKAKDINQSSSGSTEEDASHLRITTGLEASFSRLATSTSKSHNEHEAEIHGTASECADVARQLSELLEKTRVKGPRSKTKVFKATIKSTWKSKEKQDLVARLDHALSGLNSQLLLLTRSDIITHLDRSFQWHTLQGTQLQSISTQVTSLRKEISKNCHNTVIATELCELLEKPRQSLAKVRQHQILESLRFDLMYAREEGIGEAHETTYDWILEPEGPFATPLLESTSRRFQSWLKQNGGIFFIMGKPGAGKSVLMKTISGHKNFTHILESASNGTEVIVAKFFFWNAGSGHQKSFQGLVLSLLHSILSEAPDLIPAAFPKEWEETKQFSGQSWTAHHDHKKINAAFEELLRSELLYRDRKIVFLIDGLDELEGDHHHMVERIRSWSTTGGDNLNICVSSREWNVFTSGFSDCEGLQLQMLTHDDMLRTARDTLAGNNDFKRLEVSTEELEGFAESLVEKAEGVFLWTTLVLRLMQDGLSDGDEMRQLQNKLDVLPTELEDLFEHMLTSIRRGDQAYAFKMINFVSGITSGYDPPLLFRMLFLDLLYEGDQNGDPAEVLASEFQGMTRPEVEAYFQKKLSKLRKRLTGRCKCLLEIRQTEADSDLPTEQLHTPFYNESVHLAHRKVKEYIEGDKPVSMLKRFAGGINWEADRFRTLTAHIKFLVKPGHTFIGWPHQELPSCRQDDDCKGFSTCATEKFATWFTWELCVTLLGFRHNKTRTPMYLVEFLRDISTLVEHVKDVGNLFKSACSNGTFYPECGTAHIHDGDSNRPEEEWPVMDCSYDQYAGTHVSIPHICGYAAIPEFFRPGVSDMGFDPERTWDPAGLIRCTVSPNIDMGDDELGLRNRRAKTLDLILSHDLRIDCMPYGCSYKNPVEKGYDWTVWQVMLCQRILGHSDQLYPEQWNSIFMKLLDRGIDTQFCLEVHHSLRKGHLMEYPPASYPFWHSEYLEGRYLLAEIWTTPVEKVSPICPGGWVDADRPDHGPLAIFLLAEDSKLARMAMGKGGVLTLTDIFDWMGIRLEESQISNIKAPSIPCLDGWKLAPQRVLEIYTDDEKSSCGVLKCLVEDTWGVFTDSEDNFDNGSDDNSEDDSDAIPSYASSNVSGIAHLSWIKEP